MDEPYVEFHARLKSGAILLSLAGLAIMVALPQFGAGMIFAAWANYFDRILGDKNHG